MFKAVGVGARKTDSGIEVTVSIQKDDGTVVDAKEVYRGVDIPTVRAQILADLQARMNAEQDATLNTAVLGKILATV
jgi:hypothetical protein